MNRRSFLLSLLATPVILKTAQGEIPAPTNAQPFSGRDQASSGHVFSKQDVDDFVRGWNYVGNDRPPNPGEGDVYFDTEGDCSYMFINNQWTMFSKRMV